MRGFFNNTSSGTRGWKNRRGRKRKASLPFPLLSFQYRRKQGWDLILKTELCFMFWKNIMIYLWGFFVKRNVSKAILN